MPRFAANLTMLFADLPLLDRVERAASAGFRAVEILYPYEDDVNALQHALRDAGLTFVLFNVPAGDVAAGERGFANDPARIDRFRDGARFAVELAQELGVPRLNCLAGRILPDVPVRDQWQTLIENLRFAADYAAPRDVRILIEPLNTIDNPDFIICSPTRGFSLIEEIGHPNLLVQYDVYHAQRTEGNLVSTIQDHIGQIGHVQIADNPGRHQPGTGEINYPFVLQALDAAGYDGWVSLEYVPQGSTEDSLAWIEAMGYSLAID